MNADIIQQVRDELVRHADPQTKSGFRRFFKHEVKFHGVKSARVGKIARHSFSHLKGRSKSEVYALCEELLRSGYCEEAWIAANWSHWVPEKNEPGDILVFEHWIDKYIDNWAECDTLCNHTVGAFIDAYPEYTTTLKQWARSENLWLRRAAAVSLIIPAKEGRFLADIFEIANILLMDSEDMVQKGYGWMLKEASRQHQTEVFEYVMRHRRVMPRTSLRYAIEKMPAELRKQAMAKEPLGK